MWGPTGPYSWPNAIPPGYILVPQRDSNKPVNPRRELKKLIRQRDDLDFLIEEVKKLGKNKEEKKKEAAKGVSIVHASMLLMLSLPIMGLIELYCLAELLKAFAVVPKPM